MSATVGTKPTLYSRVRLLIVAALLALSMVVGISGTTTQVSAAKAQPEVVCTHYSFSDWYALTGEISNIYGFWDCDFV